MEKVEMRSHIVKDKEFFILSRSIDNATKCVVVDVFEDCFKVKLYKNGKFEVDESVELFAMTDLGQLYFETIIKDVEDDILSVWYPIDAKFLQRREFSRVEIIKSILLKASEEEISAEVIDLSAGGLKLRTNIPVSLMKEYEITLNVGNNIIQCKFQPIRIELLHDKYVVSGQFNNISNYDRIILVQYCFRKLIEYSNK